jgi:putative transposase
MPEYRRALVPGGTFFFTVVTANRAPLFTSNDNQTLLHRAIARCGAQYRFELVAMVLLPDHLHAIWTLPETDSDFSIRWRAIKTFFTRDYLSQGHLEQPLSDSQSIRGHRGVWQRRFWEHLVTDEVDLQRHLDYIHYNPVKHGLVSCPHLYEASSFHRFVQCGSYERGWMCSCHNRQKPLEMKWAEAFDME